VKSNTRNARQGGGEGPQQREDRPERQGRPERKERGERPERGERRPQERGEVSGSRIYLGNLSYEASEEDLKDLFKGVGTVRNVEIVYNRRTHKSKGYGFVDMLNTEEAKRSVEVLHDQFFMGRKLVVSGAKSKEHEDAVREEMPEPRAVQAAPAAVAAAPEVVEELPTIIEDAPVTEEAPVAEAPASDREEPTA
jgi:RNA recognition motif-containing protein